MTFDDYIKNPMGGKSSVMTNRQIYKEMYESKWNAINVRENGRIGYMLYISGDDYYAHFKIPSETVPKFYYDVVIRFFVPKEKITGAIASTLTHHDVQFYSNDPSFVYTFAHAFNTNGLFIKDLSHKMTPYALKSKALEKNPKDEIGYVKTLYFAYLQMKTLKLFDKAQWKSKAIPYSKIVWMNTIKHAEDSIRDRQELGAALLKKEHKEKAKAKHQVEKSSSNIGTFLGNINTSSPNVKDFGKFKKTEFNTIGKSSKSSKPSINKFKKSF